MFPRYAMKQAGLFMFVCAVIALPAACSRSTRSGVFGPSQAAVVSAASQPAWYLCSSTARFD